MRIIKFNEPAIFNDEILNIKKVFQKSIFLEMVLLLKMLHLRLQKYLIIILHY